MKIKQKIIRLENVDDIKGLYEEIEEIVNPVFVYCRFDLKLILFSSEELDDDKQDKFFKKFEKDDTIDPNNPDDEIIWDDDDIDLEFLIL